MSEKINNIEFWEEMSKYPRLGEILLQRKKINITQLVEALDMQNNESIPIGEALIRLGFISKEELLEELELQSNISKILTESFDEIKKMKGNENP